MVASVLVGIGVSALGFQQAKHAAALADATTLKFSLRQFALDCDRYPNSKEGLSALRRCPAGLEKKWRGPYITKLPKDPWGSAYIYKFQKGKFTITSYGSDKKAGGARGTDAEDVTVSG